MEPGESLATTGGLVRGTYRGSEESPGLSLRRVLPERDLLVKQAFKASSFQHAANSEASWFFCSVIGLSFFETVVSES